MIFSKELSKTFQFDDVVYEATWLYYGTNSGGTFTGGADVSVDYDIKINKNITFGAGYELSLGEDRGFLSKLNIALMYTLSDETAKEKVTMANQTLSVTNISGAGFSSATNTMREELILSNTYDLSSTVIQLGLSTPLYESFENGFSFDLGAEVMFSSYSMNTDASLTKETGTNIHSMVFSGRPISVTESRHGSIKSTESFSFSDSSTSIFPFASISRRVFGEASLRLNFYPSANGHVVEQMAFSFEYKL